MRAESVEHAAVVVGDLALIADLQRVDDATGERGEEPAQALDERHERLHRRARFGRREVDGEGDELALEREHDLLGDGLAGLVLRFRGRHAEMRRDDHGVELEQRRLGGGLGGEHVERGAGDATLAHGIGERGFVDDPAARGVHDAQRGLGVREELGRDQARGIGRLRQVDGEEVGAADEVHDRRLELHPELTRPIGAHVRVVGRELHAERVGTLRDEHADAPETDDAEHLVVQLDAFPLRAVPRAVPQVAIGLRDVAGLREQQRDRVLGRRQHVRLRRVHDHHAAAGRGVDVDVVEPDAGATHHLQAVAGFEHFGGDLRRTADHQRGGATHRDEQVGGREVELLVDLEARDAHRLETALGQLLGDEHAAHLPSAPSEVGPRNLAIRSMPSTIASSPSANEIRA